jgi:hypothetical protein
MDYPLIRNPITSKVHYLFPTPTDPSPGPLCLAVADTTAWILLAGPTSAVTCGRCRFLAGRTFPLPLPLTPSA